VTALYQAHALGLIRLAVVMLGDRPAAEDVVQEAFCGLYRRWHSLADTGKALAYVRSSVINGCRTVLRRRLRQRGVDPLTGDQPGESAEAIALVSEEHRQVLTAMRRLPSRQREVLVRGSTGGSARPGASGCSTSVPRAAACWPPAVRW
jgi:RNA polymerase sigma factor (sigma-70 family)